MPGVDVASRQNPQPGGSSIGAGIRGFEEQGFVGQFNVTGPGQLRCISCREVVDAKNVLLHGSYRVEGISDPGDEAVVAALECPACGARGTCTFSYGPEASRDDAVTFGDIQDARKARPGDPAATGLKPAQRTQGKVHESRHA